MEPLGNIGGWELAYDDGEPHANTRDYFLAVARCAWAALTCGTAEELGVRAEHLAGSLTLMPYDTEPNRGSAGWYRHSDDKAVVLYRRGTRTHGGSSPEGHYGILPHSSMVASVVHEMSHRAWYRLHPASRALWAEFVYTLGTEFTGEELLGMARRAEVWTGSEGEVREPLWRSLGVSPRELLSASVQLGPAQQLIADTFWWWYSSEHEGATLPAYYEWLRGRRYAKMLPTHYAKRAPTEAWPEVMADLVLYSGKMARTMHRLLVCVVQRVMADEPAKVWEDANLTPGWHAVAEGPAPSSLDRARARVLQLGG